jgi:hypothetical protein
VSTKLLKTGVWRYMRSKSIASNPNGGMKRIRGKPIAPQISRFTDSLNSPFRRNFLRVLDDTSHPRPANSTYWKSDHQTVLAAPEPNYGRPFAWPWTECSGQKRDWCCTRRPFCNRASAVGNCRSARYMGTWSSPPADATRMLNAADLQLFPSRIIPDKCP